MSDQVQETSQQQPAFGEETFNRVSGYVSVSMVPIVIIQLVFQEVQSHGAHF
jgi:hypothetical protein